MDVTKLIEGLKFCKSHDKCLGCVCNGNDCPMTVKGVHALVAHYETLLASERSKVIAEVREFVKENHSVYWTALEEDVMAICSEGLLDKLDSMDKEEVE